MAKIARTVCIGTIVSREADYPFADSLQEYYCLSVVFLLGFSKISIKLILIRPL